MCQLAGFYQRKVVAGSPLVFCYACNIGFMGIILEVFLRPRILGNHIIIIIIIICISSFLHLAVNLEGQAAASECCPAIRMKIRIFI